jgi:hypothetical protein
MPINRFNAEDLDCPMDGSAAHPRLSQGERSRRSTLISLIEAQIVPRLLVMGESTGPARTTASRVGIASNDVDEFARLLPEHGLDVAFAFVELVRQRGVPYDDICLRLLAPTAHRLAQQWEQQDLDYPELALGLNCLRELLVEIGRKGKLERRAAGGD